MSKITTFDINKEFNALNELMQEVDFDEETGEVIDNSDLLQLMLVELEQAREDKLDNIEYIKRDFKMRETALQDEIKRLQERKSMLSRKQEQLVGLQLFLLKDDKVKTDKFTFFIATTKSTVIDDEDAIPETFLKVKFSVDKAEIGKELKAGREVEGAHLQEKTGVRVR